MTLDQVNQVKEPVPFRATDTSKIYKLKGVPRVFKARASPREFHMMQLAGDCSVQAHSKVVSLSEILPDAVNFEGIIMDLATPFSRQVVKTSNQQVLMSQMIYCLERLHSTYGIIHGDMKPGNMVVCADGRLRFCDFAESRKINEDPKKWHGNVTVNYLAPKRSHYWFDNDAPPAPTTSDDLYGLGLSIWEIYTGRIPFQGEKDDDIVEQLLEGVAVDLSLILDPAVRKIVKEYLVQGGAISFP